MRVLRLRVLGGSCVGDLRRSIFLDRNFFSDFAGRNVVALDMVRALSRFGRVFTIL